MVAGLRQDLIHEDESYARVKSNGLDLALLEDLESKGKGQGKTPSFQVAILDTPEDKPADSIALVLSPDTIDDDVGIPVEKLTKYPIVCILNKMDSIYWSEEAFREFKQAALEKLKSLGINTDQTQLIPVSGLTGENVVVTSVKRSWTALEGENLPLFQYLDRILPLQSKQE